MEFVNITDGVSDGFALFYMKDGKICSVLLTQAQATMLDLVISTVFGDDRARVVPIDDELIRRMM